MSQIFKSAVSSSPTIPTTFDTDSGSATPAANNIDFFTSDTAQNDDDGIRSTASGNTVTHQLTNRQTGQVTTTDETPTTILSFTFGATPQVVTFDGYVTARRTSNGHGASFKVFSSFRSDGASSTEIGTDTSINFKDSDLITPTAPTDINITFTAVGNAAVLSAVGISGITINWDGMIIYRQVL